MFTRTKSKRTRGPKTDVTEEEAPQEERDEPEPAPLQVRKSRKRSAEPGASGRDVDTIAAPRRGKQDTFDHDQARGAKGSSVGRGKSKAKDDQPRADRHRTPSPKRGNDVTKIALPFADTPVIRRNKEMRKGGGGGDGPRRSSLSMRGRRASSLIDSGTSNGMHYLCTYTSN